MIGIMINRKPSRNPAWRPGVGCLTAMNKPLSGKRLILGVLLRALWAAVLVSPAFQAGAGVVFTSLHSFSVFTNGATPASGLVWGGGGNFYGTTSQGGANNQGTVFKITSNGVLTSLYSFTGDKDGANPYAGLAQGSDGSFYGTTTGGGTNHVGTVFKITTNGMLTSLYSFTGGYDGASPHAVLAQGNDGSFYGTTQGGGTNNAGTVFKITTNGALTSLYSFSSNDGAQPQSGLVQGSDGNFYGTTKYGGLSSSGTVFKITTNGALTRLYSFTGGNDGVFPLGELAQVTDGNFYGTTEYGGTNNQGTVFKISATGALTSLYSFKGGSDGADPRGGLLQGSDGNFYGTTYSGGANNQGTVFRIGADGVLTSLYSFTANNGAHPVAGPVLGSDKNFYGTTLEGGTNDIGTVFKISAIGALTSLYSFTGGNDGANPYAGLARGSDRSFYGTTYSGGTNHVGTVFKITTNGMLSSLYSFTTNGGAHPVAGLAQGSDGNFYGTTYYGGTSNCGTVFKITTNGALTSLYSFTGGNDGANPYAGLARGSDGNFYGTTYAGGANNCGTVFKISSAGVLTSLYSFTGGVDGANPRAGPAQGDDGNFYGTTTYGGTSYYYGTVFKITSNGMLTSLYSFDGGNDGAEPLAGLVQGSDNNFYGTTLGGGTNGSGTVFKITTNGALTSLYSFTGGNDGANPQAGLVQGSNGNFYGTTANRWSNGLGTLFKISSSGVLTSLYSFAGGNDGGAPMAGLLQGSDGSFYGTTLGGGSSGAGTVFRLTLVRAAAPVFQAVMLTNGTLNLAWSTEAAETYQLQYNSDLSSSNWTNLGGSVTAYGASLQATDSTATNGPQRFYRVVLLP
jgi:uncharacterized repeat protein (TIGR03803 family)